MANMSSTVARCPSAMRRPFSRSTSVVLICPILTDDNNCAYLRSELCLMFMVSSSYSNDCQRLIGAIHPMRCLASRQLTGINTELPFTAGNCSRSAKTTTHTPPKISELLKISQSRRCMHRRVRDDTMLTSSQINRRRPFSVCRIIVSCSWFRRW